MTAAFNRLFSTYPQFATGDFGEAMRAYFDAVELYETIDIVAAVKNFLSGSAPGMNPAFAPSAPMVGAETRRVMNLRLDAEHRSRVPLPPPTVSHAPDELARMSAKAEEAIARLTASMRTEDAAADKRQRDGWARTNARFQPDMSPNAVKRRLGFPELVRDEDAA